MIIYTANKVNEIRLKSIPRYKLLDIFQAKTTLHFPIQRGFQFDKKNRLPDFANEQVSDFGQIL